MHKRIAVAAATLAAVTGMITLAPPASAEPDPAGCPKENFCIYSGESQTGQVLVRTAGNWTGSVSGRSVFNNGVESPAEDHIQLTWTYNGATYEDCLHYNPGPGDYKWNFIAGVTFTKAVWRGEC